MMHDVTFSVKRELFSSHMSRNWDSHLFKTRNWNHINHYSAKRANKSFYSIVKSYSWNQGILESI